MSVIDTDTQSQIAPEPGLPQPFVTSHAATDTAPLITPFIERQIQQLSYQEAECIKNLLRSGDAAALCGAPRQMDPFGFWVQNHLERARYSGLEGFVHKLNSFPEETRAEFRSWGCRHVGPYLENLLEPYADPANRNKLPQLGATIEEQRQRIVNIRNAHCGEDVKYDVYIDAARTLCAALQAALHREHRVLQVNARVIGFAAAIDEIPTSQPVTNPQPLTGQILRDLTPERLQRLKDAGYTCIYLTGMHPSADPTTTPANLRDPGPGSPFSIRSLEIDPIHGTEDDLQRLIANMKAAGLKLGWDWIPNHKAVDSYLLEFNPKAFVHSRPAYAPKEPEPQDVETGTAEAEENAAAAAPEGSFTYSHPAGGDYHISQSGCEDNGEIHPYRDCAQLDLTNPHARQLVIGEAIALVRRLGGDQGVLAVLRGDMADEVISHYFDWKWGRTGRLANPDCRSELLFELRQALKERFPGVSLLFESRTNWQTMSQAADLSYCVYDSHRLNGPREYNGLWTALEAFHRLNKNTGKIDERVTAAKLQNLRDAIADAGWQGWQEGFSKSVVCLPDHDHPHPADRRAFGDKWAYAAAILSIYLPNPQLEQLGVGQGVCAPDVPDSERGYKGDGKILTFREHLAYAPKTQSRPARILRQGDGVDPVAADPDAPFNYPPESGLTEELVRHYGEFVAYHRQQAMKLREAYGLQAEGPHGERKLLDSRMDVKVVSPANPAEPWVAYMLQPLNESVHGRKTLVIVNTSPNQITVTIDRPDLGIDYREVPIPPCGPTGFWIENEQYLNK